MLLKNAFISHMVNHFVHAFSQISQINYFILISIEDVLTWEFDSLIVLTIKIIIFLMPKAYTHEPLKCKVCGHIEKYGKNKLERHMETHEKAKPVGKYKCIHCDKTFTANTHRYRHQKKCKAGRQDGLNPGQGGLINPGHNGPRS